MVRRKFKYDPDTGVLIYRKTDKEAGWLSENGYRRVSIMKKTFMATHIIWFLQTGRWPKENMVIDHINGDRADNRWANLREVPKSLNNINSNARDSKTGIRGAHPHANGGYYGRICINGRLHTKYFQTAEEAGEWYAHMRRTALETIT